MVEGTDRGPLAIHAAARPIRERRTIGAWEAWPPDPPGHVHPNHKSERPARIYCNAGGWLGIGRWGALPLGAIVATCTLVDVVPIVMSEAPTVEDDQWWVPLASDPVYYELGFAKTPPTGVVVIGRDGRLWRKTHFLRDDGKWRSHNPQDVSDQLPYGLFEPGRYAWLLADFVPVDPPIPAKGRQGLWTWTDSPGGPPHAPERSEANEDSL